MAGLYASKVIATAMNELGYLEKKTNSQLYNKTANAGYNNYTKYANDFDTKYPNFYNGKKNGYAWCDVFVDWCFVTTFGVTNAQKLLNQPNRSMGAGCDYSSKYYKQIGRFFTSNPKVGDQIFFGNSSNVQHTGLVYAVDKYKVYTIEGNTSTASGVVANGGGVCKKSYSLGYSRIYGYGRPCYDAEEVNKIMKYRVHQQTYGWSDWKTEGQEAGVTGQTKRIEAIQIDPQGHQITVKAHIQGIGWKDYGIINKDTIIGTTGQAKRIEAIEIHGAKVQCHIQTVGWASDYSNLQGTVGLGKRIESIKIKAE